MGHIAQTSMRYRPPVVTDWELHKGGANSSLWSTVMEGPSVMKQARVPMVQVEWDLYLTPCFLHGRGFLSQDWASLSARDSYSQTEALGLMRVVLGEGL